MRTYFPRFLSVLCLSLPLLYSFFGQTASAAATPSLTPIALTSSTPSGTASTDGKTIIWLGGGSFNDFNNQVYALNLSNNISFTVTTGTAQRVNPVVDGNWVVWQENGLGTMQIMAYNLSTKKEVTVGDGILPDISGNLVVWYGPVDANNHHTVMLRDIDAMTPATILDRLSGPLPDQSHSAVIDGNRVVWPDPAANQNTCGQLKTLQLGTTNSAVTALAANCPSSYDLDFKNNIVVYSSSYEIRLLNLITGENQVLTTAQTGSGRHPTTDGSYVFWEDNSGSSQFYEGFLVNIRGYSIANNSLFYVTNYNVNGVYNFSPSARNGILAWTAGGTPTHNFFTDRVYAVAITHTLPTVPTPVLPVPPPTVPSNNSAFFTETQHTLSFGFKYFWEHSGGLPVFGYPLTQEFQEANPDNNTIYTVQYFERERFEYHLEFKGTPYETELGRLGVTDAQERSLTANKAFQPAANNHQAGCAYFPQTQHNVCGDFANYWSNHGLDFGDAGTSFRESLALFGYPISEPFTDPQSGLTVQYFERARFEYHPEFKGTPNFVELGQLGKAALQAKGWQ